MNNDKVFEAAQRRWETPPEENECPECGEHCYSGKYTTECDNCGFYDEVDFESIADDYYDDFCY